MVLGIAFVLGFIYMFLLKYCAKIIAWVSILGLMGCLGGGGYYLYSRRNDVVASNYDYYLYGSYVLWGVAALYLLILLCMCNRIRLAIAIIQTTADFVGSTCRIFWIPVVFFFLIIIWLGYWAFTAIFVFSVGDIVKNATYPWATVIWTDTTRYIFLYDVFGLLWINAFLISLA